jgi:hypothetical protein
MVTLSIIVLLLVGVCLLIDADTTIVWLIILFLGCVLLPDFGDWVKQNYNEAKTYVDAHVSQMEDGSIKEFLQLEYTFEVKEKHEDDSKSE